MNRKFLTGLAAAAVLSATPMMAEAAKLPENWDNLVRVKSKAADGVWLLPGADFRPYTKVMLDPAEVAFAKDYQRNYNNDSLDLSRQITKSDVQRAVQKAQTGLNEIFAKAYEKAGYQVVTTPGPDVLRLSVGVANLYVAAPDLQTASRSASFSTEAGQGTLVIEARDSETNALIGRAIDQGVAGDTGGGWSGSRRTSVSNMADFEYMFDQWARAATRGLDRLKANSPVNTAGTVVATK